MRPPIPGVFEERAEGLGLEKLAASPLLAVETQLREDAPSLGCPGGLPGAPELGKRGPKLLVALGGVEDTTND